MRKPQPAVCSRIREVIETLVEDELEAVLGRGRYERKGQVRGYRHGQRDRQVRGTFGPVTVTVPRAGLVKADSATEEGRNTTLPADTRLTRGGRRR